MSYENRKYILFPVASLNKIDFRQIIETDKSSLRYSKDRKFVILKLFPNVIPRFIGSDVVLSKLIRNNKIEINAELKKSNWSVI